MILIRKGSEEKSAHNLRTDNENDDVEDETEPFTRKGKYDHQHNQRSGAPAQYLGGFGEVNVEAVGDLIQNRVVKIERLRFKKLQKLNELIGGVISRHKKGQRRGKPQVCPSIS